MIFVKLQLLFFNMFNFAVTCAGSMNELMNEYSLFTSVQV